MGSRSPIFVRWNVNFAATGDFRGLTGEDSFRPLPVFQLFDLPAPKRSLKARGKMSVNIGSVAGAHFFFIGYSHKHAGFF